MESKSNQLAPPWLAFQGVSAFDMFWRMGMGEEYIGRWARWFNNLSSEEQEEYIATYPAEGDWGNFYDE